MSKKKKKEPPKSKKTATVAVVFICLAAVLAAKWALDRSRNYSGQSIAARSKGSSNAPLKITEYMDFQCPACARGALFLSQYTEKYPERIRLQVKYYPLGHIHKHAYRSALYAECAARQGTFWPFHDRLVETQKAWAGMANADPVFDRIAGEVSLNREELNACLRDESVMDIIFDEKEKGRSLGVSSTPTYIINGKFVVGTQSLQEELRTRFSGDEN